MGVNVSAQERRLVEDERGVPDARRAPQQRQRHPREHGLDEEEQEGAQEDRQAVEKEHTKTRERDANSVSIGESDERLELSPSQE